MKVKRKNLKIFLLERFYVLVVFILHYLISLKVIKLH